MVREDTTHDLHFNHPRPFSPRLRDKGLAFALHIPPSHSPFTFPPHLLPSPRPCTIINFRQSSGDFMATDTLTTAPMLGEKSPTRVFKNFIDGEWVESTTGETFEDRNPADTREVVGIFQKSAK